MFKDSSRNRYGETHIPSPYTSLKAKNSYQFTDLLGEGLANLRKDRIKWAFTILDECASHSEAFISNTWFFSFLKTLNYATVNPKDKEPILFCFVVVFYKQTELILE